MPSKGAWPCEHPSCPALITAGRFCASHAGLAEFAVPRQLEERQSLVHQGSYAAWRRLREKVLREHGIPKEQWPLYDIHHTPPYDPRVEPDHRRYQLTPVLHGEHSRQTVMHDGGFGNKRAGRGVAISASHRCAPGRQARARAAETKVGT